MYAVIKTGGKQYKVAKDEVVTVEKLGGEAGDSVRFEEVLLLGEGDKTTTGTPLIQGAMVTGEVVEQTRGKKIIVFKKKRRKNHRRRNGHRQDLTAVRITDILTDGKKPSKAKAKAAPKKTKASAKDQEAKKTDDAPKAEAAKDEAPAAEE